MNANMSAPHIVTDPIAKDATEHDRPLGAEIRAMTSVDGMSMHSFEAELDNADEDDQEEEDDFDADDVDAFIPLTQTFVRHTAPQELLDTFNRTKTRGVQLDFGLQTTLLAGGGRIRGDICLKFSPKAKKNRLTQIAGIKLDCIGFEAVKDGQPKMFFNVAQDVLDTSLYLRDLATTFLQDVTTPDGTVFVPFAMQLPLDVGPGSFEVPSARICYKMFCTVLLRNQKRFPKGRSLREVRDVKIYPMLDPQKVLLPAEAPIQSIEDSKVRFGGGDTLKVAGRLHRATWVAGQTAQVEVSVTNDTKRDVRKIHVQLVRNLITYKAAAASAAHQAVSGRVPDKIVTQVVASDVLERKSDKSDDKGWKGVDARSRSTVLRRIDIPATELSIAAGRYFETRYVLKIAAQTGGGKASIELPVTIVNMSSIDVMPNELGTVTRMVNAYTTEKLNDDVMSGSALSRRGSSASRRTSLQIDLRSPGHSRRPSGDYFSGPPSPAEGAPRRSISRQPSTSARSIKSAVVADGDPANDLRRALSVEYQHRFAKLDISADAARITDALPLQRRVSDQKSYHGTENLARRLHREANVTPNFADLS